MLRQQWHIGPIWNIYGQLYMGPVRFKPNCLCFYDIALWRSYNVGSLNRFRSRISEVHMAGATDRKVAQLLVASLLHWIILILIGCQTFHLFVLPYASNILSNFNVTFLPPRNCSLHKIHIRRHFYWLMLIRYSLAMMIRYWLTVYMYILQL